MKVLQIRFKHLFVDLGPNNITLFTESLASVEFSHVTILHRDTALSVSAATYSYDVNEAKCYLHPHVGSSYSCLIVAVTQAHREGTTCFLALHPHIFCVNNTLI